MQAVRRHSTVTEWVAFVLQVAIAISFEVGDDVGRALFSQHGTLQGVRNARDVVAFEAAHGLWLEPAWQMFFLQTRHIFTLTVTWLDVAQLMNGIYVFGHVFVTLGVALWVYWHRRPYFALVRNIVILTNVFALVMYENFPVAPPRMTSGLIFNHHTFHFQDTVFGIMSSGGRFVGPQVGYNEFSAMPSVHIAWAIIASGTVIFLTRSATPRVLAAVYPVLMLVAVVVTGNHYLMDALGAIFIVVLALLAALAVERWKGGSARFGVLRRGLVGGM
ncbi:MAG: hypothetical protein NVSMB52_07260 [Chloroflexota bacterium]